MIGLTRGPVTLIAAGCAGLIIWIATQVGDSSNGGYWATYGLIAAAGLLMALSQVAGGWTKWGWPRISPAVFLIAFLPVAICVLWVTLTGQPDSNWFRSHVVSWSNDIGIDNVVRDLLAYLGVLAFGAGLVLGFTADTAPATTPADRPARQNGPVERPLSREPADGRRVERVPSR